MQWGHGEQDYSAVVRKYLYEPAAGFYEQPQMPGAHEIAATQAAVTDLAEAAAEDLQVQGAGLVVSQESLLGLTETVSDTTPADTPVRRGFLRQLLSRFSSGQG